MTKPVSPIPEDQRGPSLYICVHDAPAAIEFYKRTLGATEVMRIAEPSGRIGHAELIIGGGKLMLSDEYPDHGALSPRTIGGTPVTLHLYVENADAVVAGIVEAGAKLARAVETQFYGDRGGMVIDPFGHRWWIATHVEDVSPEELDRRAQAQHGQSAT